VAAGQASIGTPSASGLTVTQSSDRAVINWTRFDVGTGQSVTFRQPGAASATLNRVGGDATSTIAGRIEANGQVFLVNPNGISITSTGSVRAAGFVASTLDIGDADFLAGRLDFRGTGNSARVSNAGRIEALTGGFAALLGGSVAQHGTLFVPLGRVGLASGERVTLDLQGNGFMQVAVPSGSGASTGSALSGASSQTHSCEGSVTTYSARSPCSAR
jgi:filamentous hemagglutinin family protein